MCRHLYSQQSDSSKERGSELQCWRLEQLCNCWEHQGKQVQTGRKGGREEQVWRDSDLLCIVDSGAPDDAIAGNLWVLTAGLSWPVWCYNNSYYYYLLVGRERVTWATKDDVNEFSRTGVCSCKHEQDYSHVSRLWGCNVNISTLHADVEQVHCLPYFVTHHMGI